MSDGDVGDAGDAINGDGDNDSDGGGDGDVVDAGDAINGGVGDDVADAGDAINGEGDLRMCE